MCGLLRLSVAVPGVHGWSLQPGFPYVPGRCCVSWQQDADSSVLNLAERLQTC